MRLVAEGKSLFFLVVLPVLGLIFLVYLTLTAWREMSRPTLQEPPKQEHEAEAPPREQPVEAKPVAPEPHKAPPPRTSPDLPKPAVEEPKVALPKPLERPPAPVAKPEEAKRPEPPKEVKSGKAKSGVLGILDQLNLNAQQRKQVDALTAERDKRLKYWHGNQTDLAKRAREDIHRDFLRELERVLTRAQIKKFNDLAAQQRGKMKGK